MNKSSLTATALAVISALVLSACIKIDVTETIDKNGQAAFVLVYDFSEMAKAMQGMGESMSSDESSSVTGGSFDDFNCASFLADMKTKPGSPMTKIKNLKCVDKSPSVIEISGTTKLSRRDFVRRKGVGKTIYMLRGSEMTKFTDGMDEQEAKTSSDLSTEDSEMAKGLITLTMKITMPGKITKAPYGTIQGNTLLVTSDDLAALQKNVRGFVRSEE